MNSEKDKKLFSKFIIQNNVIGFFENPLKLKSGRLSYWYVNWRDVTEDVYLMDKLSDFIITFINDKGLKPDTLYGVPEGATKLGLITQYKWAKRQPSLKKKDYCLSMGRAKPKEHGDPKDKYFLGFPRGNVIVLEDTLTTGTSLLNTIEMLKSFNVTIIATIVLTNRNEIRMDGTNIEDIMENRGINFYAMSEAIEILPLVCQKLKPSDIIKQRIIDYFNKYGAKKINLV